MVARGDHVGSGRPLGVGLVGTEREDRADLARGDALQGALARADGNAILAAARALAESFGTIDEGWNGFNVLHTAAARVGGLDLGLVPGKGGSDVEGILKGVSKGEIGVVFLLGADEIDTERLADAFVIYQGHHGDRGATCADVILPGAAYTEKDATYVNTEGRPQRAERAIFPPGEAKEDWKILRALSEALGHTVPLNTLGQVRARLAELAPMLAVPGHIEPAAWQGFGRQGKLGPAAFVSPIEDFYRTDPISRSSSVMAECSALHATPPLPATGTDG
jgi:NADH-quinone oxidoreductase subunit G